MECLKDYIKGKIATKSVRRVPDFQLLQKPACMTLKHVEAKEDVRQSLLLSVVQSAGLPASL